MNIDELHEKVGSLTATLKLLFDSIKANQNLSEENSKKTSEHAVKIAVIETQVEVLKKIDQILPDFIHALESIQEKVFENHVDAQILKNSVSSFKDDIQKIIVLREQNSQTLAVLESEIVEKKLSAKIEDLQTLLYELSGRNEKGEKLPFSTLLVKDIFESLRKSAVNGLIILLFILIAFTMPFIGDSLKQKLRSILIPPQQQTIQGK